MSYGTNYYKFDTLDEIEEYLDDDLKRMMYSINKYGFVCEEQYERLTSKLLEEHATKLMEILTEKTGRQILYAYAEKTVAFVLYDPQIISRENAIAETNAFLYEFFENQY